MLQGDSCITQYVQRADILKDGTGWTEWYISFATSLIGNEMDEEWVCWRGEMHQTALNSATLCIPELWAMKTSIVLMASFHDPTHSSSYFSWSTSDRGKKPMTVLLAPGDMALDWISIHFHTWMHPGAPTMPRWHSHSSPLHTYFPWYRDCKNSYTQILQF